METFSFFCEISDDRECVLMFWSGCGSREAFRAPCQLGFSHNVHCVYLYMISSWGSLLIAFQQLPVTPQVSPCFSLWRTSPRGFFLVVSSTLLLMTLLLCLYLQSHWSFLVPNYQALPACGALCMVFLLLRTVSLLLFTWSFQSHLKHRHSERPSFITSSNLCFHLLLSISASCWWVTFVV